MRGEKKKEHAGVPLHYPLEERCRAHLRGNKREEGDYFFSKVALSSKKAGLPLGIITTRWSVVFAWSVNV